MAKFLNKKEQVYDLQLTSYAKYLMSIGKFKPAYYAFFDDNVIYDIKYSDTNTVETQNKVNNRIKEDTQYIEGIVHFKSLEKTVSESPDDSLVSADRYEKTQRMTTPSSPGVFRIDNGIGDAFLNGPTQAAPAWKVLALRSQISSSQERDLANETFIPQINIDAKYTVSNIRSDALRPEDLYADVRSLTSYTATFIDDRILKINQVDPILYLEEANTELLANNFDIEVFEVIPASNSDDGIEQLKRKYFREKESNVKDGFMIADAPIPIANTELTSDYVEFYFDILFDQNADQREVCKSISNFDKNSYYVDVGFDCDNIDTSSNVYDIYQTVLEPEICEEVEDVCLD